MILLVADSEHNIGKAEKTHSSFTWQSMEANREDCNAYALLILYAPIIKIVYVYALVVTISFYLFKVR